MTVRVLIDILLALMSAIGAYWAFSLRREPGINRRAITGTAVVLLICAGVFTSIAIVQVVTR